MRDVSHVDVRVEEQPIGSITIKSEDDGCESSKRFVLHDVENPESRQQVLWEVEESVESWDVCSVTSDEGQCFLYVLFNHEDDMVCLRLLLSTNVVFALIFLFFSIPGDF